LEGSHLHKLSQRLVTTPGELARQIMQQVYTKANLHLRLDHAFEQFKRDWFRAKEHTGSVGVWHIAALTARILPISNQQSGELLTAAQGRLLRFDVQTGLGKEGLDQVGLLSEASDGEVESST
jgi:hypothetical protein